MRIIYDAEKRARTLRERGLDFERCGEIFDGTELTRQDARSEYGERGGLPSAISISASS